MSEFIHATLCVIAFVLAPRPPIDVRLTANDGRSVEVAWDVDESTGLAKLFKVYLTFEGTNYEEVADCENLVATVSVNETSDRHLHLQNFEPYSRYSLEVSSENEFGISNRSEKLKLNTRSANPSPPREISVKMIPNDFDDSKVSAVIEWKPPCRPAGVIELYSISWQGSRKGFEGHSKVGASSFLNYTTDDLRRGYNYEVKVKAFNSEKFSGEVEKLSFTAPSGSEFDRRI